DLLDLRVRVRQDAARRRQSGRSDLHGWQCLPRPAGRAPRRQACYADLRGSTMKLEGEQTLLRVHLRNTDKFGWWRLAADTLVSPARKQGLTGATVLRGFFGLDVSGTILESRSWSLVEHDPVVVEVVDEPRRIGRFMDTVAEVVREGMATLERGHVLVYRSDR